MSDIKPITDVINAASDAIHTNLPETAKQSDGVLSTVLGFFNNVVFYPLKKANISFKYKLEAFEEDLKKKVEKIPKENLQLPPTMIAGPTLEGLKYTYDEEDLREMYENLLASSMDTRIVSKAHPSFVDTIKQMSPVDAKVLQIISKYQQLRCYKIQFVYQIDKDKRVYTFGMPDYYVIELSGIADNFSVSSSLINLRRLGLIVINDGTLHNSNYSQIQTDKYYQAQLAHYKTINPTLTVDTKYMTVELENYGIDFINVCLPKEESINAD